MPPDTIAVYMADDQYLISPRPTPEPSQRAQHPADQRRANTAIGIACLAAFFTAWQAYESHQTRVDARNAAATQASDVERARKAAERSADHAGELAEGMKKTAALQDKSLGLAERQFTAFRSAIHGGMQAVLYDVSASTSGDFMKFRIANKGRLAALVGKSWCGGGVHVPTQSPSGSLELRLVMDSSPEIFRRRTIAPDAEEELSMPVIRQFNPNMFASNPILALIKPATEWTVVCDIPYSDELDSAPSAHRLQFCYYTGGESGAALCPADTMAATLEKLRSASRHKR